MLQKDAGITLITTRTPKSITHSNIKLTHEKELRKLRAQRVSSATIKNDPIFYSPSSHTR